MDLWCKEIEFFGFRKSSDPGPQTEPRSLEMWDRLITGLLKTGMPEA